jgi:hypothetical protein
LDLNLQPDRYERATLAERISVYWQFSRRFTDVCSRLVAAFYWLSIGWALVD